MFHVYNVINLLHICFCGLPRWLSGKESACNAGDPDLIPGSWRSPGEGNGNPFQYSCLENPMDGGAWYATLDGVAKNQTWLSDFTSLEHSLTLPFFGIGMKTDFFQSCGHCWVFQICWYIECNTFTASSFRIWNSSAGIPSPPLALTVWTECTRWT